MPHYHVITELPIYRSPVGKKIWVCAKCIERRFCNEPMSLGKLSHCRCKVCEKTTSCRLYEKKRLRPVAVKKRIVAMLPAPPPREPTVMEYYNIFVR